jgi:hypothetical protein
MSTSSIRIIPSATIASTTEASSAFTQFILRQIGCAKLRAELVVNQIEAAETALSGGMISAEQAILILAECRIEVSS